mgnify:CR=1 FL=1
MTQHPKTSWGAVFAMSLAAFVLVASEFMPVSLLTPIAADLHVTEGQAGQGIAVSGGVDGVFGPGTETALKEFQGKQGRAANLEPLKQQLAQMEVMLQQMLRQLPSKNEMPDLIVDVSQTALASGINNELFQPGAETQREFYAEKPISLRMVGTYHQFGAFVSGVASLPRVVIMTMHDIQLKPRGAGDTTLVLEGTVKTYRYLDEDEEAEAAAGAGSTGEVK